MASKKRESKTVETSDGQAIEIIRTTIEDLTPDDLNANKGSPRGQAMIERSFQQYGAGRSTLLDKNGRLIAGNKATEAFAATGGEEVIIVRTNGKQLVAVQRMDVDLDTVHGRELAIADNRAQEVSLTWDAEVLEQLQDQGVALDQFWTTKELELKFSDLDPNRHADDGDGEYDSLDDAPEELPGAAALKPDMYFESKLPYNIPEFKPEMLAELPEELDVWAGPDALPDDPDFDILSRHWLYCYGSDSTRGLPWHQAILCFYVDDSRFLRWWDQPDVYTAKMLNVGLPTIIAPNFSLWLEMPKAVQIYNTFRARYMGRYFQEAGLKLIPDVNWSDRESFEFCLLGIPVEAPVIAMQVQTVSSPGELARLKYGVERSLAELKPQKLLLYGGGKTTKAQLAGSIPDDLPTVWLDSRAIRRHDRVMSEKAQRRIMTGSAVDE
jgi:hypothetical protein